MASVRPGSKVWNANAGPKSAGTVCAIAKMTSAPDKRYLISCAHVLAPNGEEAGIGADKICVGPNGDEVGVLIAAKETGQPEGNNPVIDVAIAEINRDIAAANPQFEGGGTITGLSKLRIKGLSVFARGFDDSEFRQRKIDGMNQNRIEIEGGDDNTFANEGDSGAAVLNRFGRVTGMITSHKPLGGKIFLAFATPIEVVFREAEKAAGFSAGTLQPVYGDSRNIDLLRGVGA